MKFKANGQVVFEEMSKSEFSAGANHKLSASGFSVCASEMCGRRRGFERVLESPFDPLFCSPFVSGDGRTAPEHTSGP